MIKRFFIVFSFIFFSFPSIAYGVTEWDDPFFDSGLDLWTVTYPDIANDSTWGATTTNQYGEQGVYIETPATLTTSTQTGLLSSFVDISDSSVYYNWTQSEFGFFVSTTVQDDFQFSFCSGLTTASTYNDITNTSSMEWIFDNSSRQWVQLDGTFSDSICLFKGDYTGSSGGMFNFTTVDFNNIPSFIDPVRAFILWERTDTTTLDNAPYFYIGFQTGLSTSSIPVPPSASSTVTYFLQYYQNNIVLVGIFFAILALARPLTTVFRLVYNQYKKDTYTF